MSLLPQIWTDYKKDELANIYKGKGTQKEKESVYEILFAINASQNATWGEDQAVEFDMGEEQAVGCDMGKDQAVSPLVGLLGLPSPYNDLSISNAETFIYQEFHAD